MLCYVILCNFVMFCYVILCFAMLHVCYVLLCYVMSCHAMLCLQWNPNLNLEDKWKLIQEIRESGKSRVKVQCFTKEGKQLLVQIIGSFEKLRFWEIGIPLKCHHTNSGSWLASFSLVPSTVCSCSVLDLELFTKGTFFLLIYRSQFVIFTFAMKIL